MPSEKPTKFAIKSSKIRTYLLVFALLKLSLKR
jgi:hypothetical protein